MERGVLERTVEGRRERRKKGRKEERKKGCHMHRAYDATGTTTTLA
jgi:hypothetical protein